VGAIRSARDRSSPGYVKPSLPDRLDRHDRQRLAQAGVSLDEGTLPGPALLLCQGGARFERVEDDAYELSFEAADRFAAALALGLFALEVGARGRMHARLRDRDPVESAVELDGCRRGRGGGGDCGLSWLRVARRRRGGRAGRRCRSVRSGRSSRPILAPSRRRRARHPSGTSETRQATLASRLGSKSGSSCCPA
jgi:hypothetical protein